MSVFISSIRIGYDGDTFGKSLESNIQKSFSRLRSMEYSTMNNIMRQVSRCHSGLSVARFFTHNN